MTLSKILLSYLIFLCMCFFSCNDEEGEPLDPDPEDETILPPVEAEQANTIGFFEDDWQPRTFIPVAYAQGTKGETVATTVTADASAVVTKIPRSIFGHNGVWWMGDPTTQAVTDIKNLDARIIRFPGGNSSNNYFWNMEQDNLPDDVPSTYIDAEGQKLPASYLHGKSDYNWQFNLQKYYNLLQTTGTEGIISVNYSYARYSTAQNPVASAAHLAADWVRFDNGRTQYWELGNENYGNWQAGYRIDLSLNRDGQPEFITGQLYAKHAKVFIDSMRKAADEIGKKIYIGVVIHESPATESWQTTTTKTWNSGLIPELENKADFYVVHNYFTASSNVNATGIFAAARKVPGEMIDFVKGDLQKFGATVKPIVFDEWNMFAMGAKQQVSSVSGAFAVVVLGESIKHRYGMAARWDLLNGWSNGDDHGLFSPGDEPGVPKWQPRPSFYYLYFFRKLLGDRLVNTTVEGNSAIAAYGSTFSSGELNVTLVNTGSTANTVEVKTKNFKKGARYYWYLFEGGADNGEFSRKVLINGTGPTEDAGGPLNYTDIKARSQLVEGGIKITLPARTVAMLVVDKE